MQLNLKRKQFAMYGGNNNFTSVSYPSGSIQSNPASTSLSSTQSVTTPAAFSNLAVAIARANAGGTGIKKTGRPSLDSYATTNSQKGMITPVKKQSFRSNLDPALPPSRWAGRITPYNRDRFTPDPNIGTVKNSPLRPLGAPKSPMSSLSKSEMVDLIRKGDPITKKISYKQYKQIAPREPLRSAMYPKVTPKTAPSGNGYYFQKDHIGAIPNPATMQQRRSRYKDLVEAFSKLPKPTPALDKLRALVGK